MKTPQELNEDYDQYVDDAVIKLDEFFNEKIIQQKLIHPEKKTIIVRLYPSCIHGNDKDRAMYDLLQNKNILDGFIGSCYMFGWDVKPELTVKYPKITFTEKYTLGENK